MQFARFSRFVLLYPGGLSHECKTKASSGTTAPAFPSIRANRSIRSNNSNVKMLINGVSIEIDTAVSEEFLGKLIKAVCHA